MKEEGDEMPVYTYRCRKCGSEFDLLVGVVAEEQKARCSKCGSTDLEKLLTTFGVKSEGSTADKRAART